MSEAAFKTDKEFSGSDGGPTGYDDFDLVIYEKVVE